RSPERSGLETAARRKNNRITQRADCQVLQLPTERRRSNSRGSLRIVSGLAENTDSIFCDGPQGSETVNGCPVLRRQEHRREAHVRAAGSDRFNSARSSEARVRRILFSLTKDLHGGRRSRSNPKWSQERIGTGKSACGL